ncbi:uncharacterized protein LTHEOB_145 [Lasiodiplodia theobromae]|uniref:uncharacterized protein n=1 Tax=Lasiodiplodia theobromae TaxID=45133 RepID=UPI0015C2D5C9|nr:uncharacterized protein LTHEOB_145 [Lasiodiplodia theobromae]KAF4543446.1 hypothetical protein LTHEOB_145 [Lasiodiplodia theobromae]
MPNQPPGTFPIPEARARMLAEKMRGNLEQNRASTPSAASDTTGTASSATLSPTDNPATPMPGGATHPAYYQPPPPPPPHSPQAPDDQTATPATSKNNELLRHLLLQELQKHPTTAPTTPAPQHPMAPTPAPNHMAPPPLLFTHTHGRAHLHPHERLAADIPRLHARPLPYYTVAPTRGALADDVTDYIPSQAWASAANLPVGLGWLEQPEFVVKQDHNSNRNSRTENDNNTLVPLLRDAQTGRVAEGALGQPLYDLPILASRISTQVEAWRVAMWLCYDGRVTLYDVSARMRVVRTSEQLEIVEDALARRVVMWCEQHAGMMFHVPVDVVTERDVRLVGELGEEKVLRNARWDLWRRVPGRGVAEKEEEYERRGREAEPVFVTQPRKTADGGEGGLGAMWPALRMREGVCYGEKAAVALGEWQEREKERLTGVPRQKKKKVDMAEEMLHKWLFGTRALRERPTPRDAVAMSRDPKWALERWNVEPYDPAAVDPRLQHDTGAGLHSPYLNSTCPTVAAGAFSHPHGQPPDNTSNAGHGTPGSAGLPMQNSTAQTSPHPTLPSASPHTPQMSLQSPTQQASQSAPASGPQVQSNAAMGLGLSNIHLPNTAQPQHHPSTPTVPAAMPSPNASSTMQSPSRSPQSAGATIGQRPSGPFTPPLQHAQARPAPATAPATRFVNMDRDSYGRPDNQGVVQEAHARRTPTPNAGDSLWPNTFKPPSPAGGPGT